MTKSRRGKWAGHPATLFAGLLGCSASTAKRLLTALRTEKQQELTLEDIGELIFEYRYAKGQSAIDRFLSRWTGPQQNDDKPH